MKNAEDPRLLAHKREVDTERRAQAILRRRQETLALTTPGLATPGTVRLALVKRGL
jgi:hypothetical protein